MSYLSHYRVYEEKHVGTIKSNWENLEYDRLRSLKSTDIVVDAGAGIGAFTVKAALQAEFVYAFEPEFQNFQALKANTNIFSNVGLFQKALWHCSETKPLYLSENWGGHSLVPKPPEKTKGVIDVSAVALDDVVKSRVDFLKVDVEATELELFQGAKNLLTTYKPFIAVEIHSIPIFEKVQTFLSTFGYEVRGGIIDSHLIEIHQPTYGTVYFA